MPHPDPDDYRVKSGRKVRLDQMPTRADLGLSRDELDERTSKALKQLDKLQGLLYAESRRRLLIVLQGPDTAGKDSTIRHVFGPLNPQGVAVVGFKAPTAEELAHDFLWRIHRHVPGNGQIVVFNRSHYEDVLIVRVRGLAPKKVWSKRYEHINAFEKMLADEGVTIVKLFLHVSKAYQKQRLQRRLDQPDKHWKFNPADLRERALWGAYRKAYEAAMEKCSPPWAPWYAIPAEDRPARNLIIATLLVRTLEGLKMSYPRPTFDPAKITIR